jgi:hypothetical protein
MALIWPKGYAAQDEPLRIFDEKGHPVGEVGKQIALGGGPGRSPYGSVVGCGEANQVWVVSEVVPLS